MTLVNLAFPASPKAFRTVFSVGGLVILWGLEQWRPFKPPVDPRWRRWGRNMFLSLSNAALLEVALGGAVVAWAAHLERRGWGLLRLAGAGPVLNVALTLLFLDLATYAFHRLYHEFSPMWRLHRAHHSDRDLDVTSASRFHVAEIFLSTGYRLALMPLWGPSLRAIVAFESSLLFFAQWEHANLALPGDWDRRLRKIFVTPDMHRVHHSDVVSHTNSNYSTIFSFWDRLFGTYNVEGIDQREIRIGLREYARAEDVTLPRLLVAPFGPACDVAVANDGAAAQSSADLAALR